MLVFFCMLYMVVTMQLTKGQLQTSWKTLPVFHKRCFNTSLSRHWVSKNIRVLHSHLEYFLLELSGTCFLETSVDCSGTLVVRLLKVPKHTALINYVLFISTVHSRVHFHTKKINKQFNNLPLSNFSTSEFCQIFASNFPKKSIRFFTLSNFKFHKQNLTAHFVKFQHVSILCCIIADVWKTKWWGLKTEHSWHFFLCSSSWLSLDFLFSLIPTFICLSHENKCKGGPGRPFFLCLCPCTGNYDCLDISL